MRKRLKIINAILLVTLSFLMLLTMHDFKIRAAGENIGAIREADVPAWVVGHEETVRLKFVEAYSEANFTVEPEQTVQAVDLGKARVILYQDYGSEGTIFLNDVEGKALVVKNTLAISQLKVLLGLEGDPLITDANLKGLLLDVVESSGETYYITDRRNDDGIFKIGKNASNEDEVQYLDKRIGVGAHDHGDVTWIEYTKGYQQGHIHMSSLGLPVEAVTRHRYTTSDVNTDGTYVKTDNVINTSEKEHTAQKFEHGWLIQARVRVLNADGTLGGDQNVQYGAAPILNDMYALVTGLDGNSDLSKTGAPVSVEFLVDGVRYQNFEYGYVKVEAGVATFIPEAVVDSHATEMTRRVGISESWINWNSPPNQAYGLNYERLRIGQNFRELVGQMIRDDRTPFKPSSGDPYGDTRLVHSGNAAPAKGVWFSGKDGEGPFLGAANVFLYQAHWYHDAFELAPVFNTPLFVDAQQDIGRPTHEFKRFYNVIYQEFDGGIAYKSSLGEIVTLIGEAEVSSWLGDYPDIESALIGKDIVLINPNHEIGTFKPGSEPAWAKDHLSHITQAFQEAYDNASFNEVADLHINGFTLDKARIMFFQQFGSDGYIVMNEFLGKAFVLTTEEFNSLKPTEVFLATFVSGGQKYIVTDQRVYNFTNNVVSNYEHVIGVGLDRDYPDVTLNDFTKAYKMAENYHPQGLGLPIEGTRRVSYNTYDLNNDGTYVEGKTRSNKMRTIQQFEHGYIISARMRIESGGNYNVQHGAAPITNEMYNKVIALPNNQTLNETGAPVSIQFIHNGIKYQNFEYGYVKLEVNGVATFIKDLVVDSKATEMNRRIGASDGFNNWLNRPTEYELAWERLRIGQNFREAMGELIRSGRQPYITSTSDPLGDTRIHHVPHEFDQMGVVHVYKDGEGSGGHVFGNALVIQGYWYNKAYELAPLLNELGAGFVGEGEDRVYHRTLLGRPSGQWQTISNLTFQPFEKGIAYKDGANPIVMIYGSAFKTWMGSHETIMDAIIAKKLIKWDVRFYNADDTLLKTVRVAHAQNATNMAPTVTPPAGQTFLRWDKDITLIKDNLDVRPVFEPIRYSVEFKDFDGRIISTQEVLHGATATAPTNPARLGYTFSGWDRALTNITADTTIYAQYTINEYTITYLPEGITHSNPVVYNIESTIELTNPSLPNGYVFLRWENEEGVMVEEIHNQIGDLVLTAKFTPITYHITYHNLLEGDINTSNPTTFTIHDLPLSLSSLLITRTGHTFEGWYLNSELTNPVSEINAIGDHTLYAKITPNPHTITYQVEGLEDVVESYVYGQAITIRPLLEKVGYSFNWNKVLPPTMPDEDLLVIGSFTPKVYTITYLPEGLNHANQTTYTIETQFQLLDAFKTGYTFVEWHNELNEVIQEIPLGQTGDKTLKAIFTLNQYEIIYNLDGGDNHLNNKDHYTIENDTIILYEPTKQGYTFLGWFEDDQFEYEISEIIPIEWLPSGVELYAKWSINSYTISFDSDGGSPVGSIKEDYQTEITKPEDPTKQGHTFIKWVDENNDEYAFSTMPAHNVSLKALWSINQYTIAFELNGGELDSVFLTQDYNSALNLPTPTKEDDSFRGWFIDELLKTQFTLTHMPDYDFTLYAGYTKLPIITLDLDGGSFHTLTITQEPNSPIDLEGVPTKLGYYFSGWSTALPQYMPTENLTIKAMWVENDYTISFNSDGGSLVMPITKPYNSEITAPENPEKEGYRFIQWVDENNDLYVFNTMPAKDITLKAIWEINQYSIHFDSDGGSLVDSITQDYQTTIIKPTNPIKEGYTFMGWSPDLPEYMPAQNKTLKAIWQVNRYQVIVKVEGSSDYHIAYDYNEVISPLEEPEKEGYTFSGWDIELPSTMPANDIVISALFEVRTYQITYHNYDGTHENMDTYTILSPTITLLDAQKEGYMFLGWYPLIDAGEVIQTIEQGSTGDIELHARYRILSYKVTYIIDEMVFGEIESYIYQSPITKRDTPTKEGYTFSGWDNEIPSYMPAEDLIFKGSFSINTYEVIFKDKDDNLLGDVQIIEHNKHAMPPEAPIIVGYTFKGWDQPTTSITSNKVIKAMYTINSYSVSFIDIDGFVIGEVQTVNYGGSAIAPIPPLVEGFIFDKWSHNFNHITANIEVKAVYNIQTYEVLFIDHYDKQIGNTIVVNHGDSAIAPEVPTIEGYTFVGWDKTLDIIKKNTTIKAIYEAIIHDVKFIDMEGNQIGQIQRIRHFQAAIAPDAPMVLGYTFVGWDTDFGNITTSLEVRALYELNSYEVKFLDSNKQLIGEVQIILHGQDATPPSPPSKEDYTFVRWSHSYENIQQSIEIIAIYELAFNQADLMSKLRELKVLVNQVNVLSGLLSDLPANEYYMLEVTLDKLKTDIENIEYALLTATNDEEVLAISKQIEQANKEYNLSVVQGEKEDDSTIDPNPEDPTDPTNPQTRINIGLIVLASLSILVFVGIIIRMVFRFRK